MPSFPSCYCVVVELVEEAGRYGGDIAFFPLKFIAAPVTSLVLPNSMFVRSDDFTRTIVDLALLIAPPSSTTHCTDITDGAALEPHWSRTGA